MVAGTPVVTSSITSLPEVCGDAAWYVEPTDPERIFEAARRLLREPELAADLVQKGHAHARKFTWRETARQTLIASSRPVRIIWPSRSIASSLAVSFGKTRSSWCLRMQGRFVGTHTTQRR